MSVSSDSPVPPAGLHADSVVDSPRGVSVPTRSAASRLALPVAVGCALLALAALATAVLTYQRLSRSEQQLARRLQATELAQQELVSQLKTAQDAMRDVQGRNAVLEARLADSVGQQAQLEKLYQDIARNRDDWVIAEVESAIAAAAQQLQLTGNVRGALLALQDADARLASSNRPPLIGLRRVLARDIERLRALPAVDPAGQAIRLDAVIASIDQLPMLADARLGGHHAESQPAVPATLRERLARAGGASWSALAGELAELVRIRRVDSPDALLLSPTQAYFLRENLKLRLTAARTALLARQDGPYRADLGRAIDILERDFDARDRQVAGAVGMLKTLRDSPSKLELPVLTESLAAVRQMRGREAP